MSQQFMTEISVHKCVKEPVIWGRALILGGTCPGSLCPGERLSGHRADHGQKQPKWRFLPNLATLTTALFSSYLVPISRFIQLKLYNLQHSTFLKFRFACN